MKDECVRKCFESDLEPQDPQSPGNGTCQRLGQLASRTALPEMGVRVGGGVYIALLANLREPLGPVPGNPCSSASLGAGRGSGRGTGRRLAREPPLLPQRACLWQSPWARRWGWGGGPGKPGPVRPVPPQNNLVKGKLTCVDVRLAKNPRGRRDGGHRPRGCHRSDRRGHTHPPPANGGGRGGQVRGTGSRVLAEFGSVTTATALDERWPLVNAVCP